MLKKISQSVLFLLMTAMAGTALAQWQWEDENGKKVFSDRPPPITVPENKILKGPRGSNVGAKNTNASSTSQAEQKPAEAAADQDAELKAKAEEVQKAEEAVKEDPETVAKNAQIEKDNAAARKSNCANARSRLTQLEPGKRVAAVDANGNMGFMSDETRAAQRKSAQEAIQKNCS